MKTNILMSADGICKRFGGVVAAENIRFDLHEGEILGLIGPNGAGKTTLLNMLSGIYACDEGEITFLGKNVTNVPPYERARMGLARTFQSPRFLARSTIRNNLLLGTDLGDQIGYMKSFLGKKGRDFDAEFYELLKIAGFEIDMKANIDGVPYGQRKLLEIIRALLSHPKVMLVDEPAAGLNDKELEKAVSLIRYGVDSGVGVVLIEHQMDMIMNVCDNILVLNFGRMIGFGTPREVSAMPQVIEAYLGRRKRDA